MVRHNNIFKKPIFVAGLVFFFVWIVLYRGEILGNLELLLANWLAIVLGIVAVAVVAVAVIVLGTTINKKKNIPTIV